MLMALLYFVTGELNFELLSGNKIVNIGVFLPEGIALAFALYYGRFILAGIFFGQLLLAYTNSITFEASLGVAMINTLEAYLAIRLAAIFGLDIRLLRLRDIMILMGMILFILQPLSAIGSNFILLFYHQLESETIVSTIFSWWFGNVMGQMLITPFVLLLLQKYNEFDLQEFLLYGFAFFLFDYFLELIVVITNPFLLLSFTLPIVVYIIFKKDLIYGLFFNVIAALVSSYAVYKGIGAFQASTTVDNIINYNLFILAHVTISLTAGILLAEKRDYEKHLEDTVTKELKKNRQQQLFMLQQSRLAQMGEMISMIAHQWRQPLNNLSMINQTLLKQYDTNRLDDKAIEYFRVNSHKQIILMSQTVDDFRNFFRSDKSKENFSVHTVIENILEITKAIFQSYEIKIVYEKPKNELEVYGHANEFSQVILNIINNAKDALLEKDIPYKEISLIVKRKDNMIVVIVEDNAGGIEESIQENIFDPYFSTKKAKNGTGLGLYMSKMIIEEQMGGRLEVHNTQKGACFVISLRVKEGFD